MGEKRRMRAEWTGKQTMAELIYVETRTCLDVKEENDWTKTDYSLAPSCKL
jgi:hypothetical protein